MKITLQIDEDLLLRLRAEATRQGRSVAELAADLLGAGIDAKI